MYNKKEPTISGTERGIHRHVLTWHFGKNLIPMEVSLFIKSLKFGLEDTQDKSVCL